MSGTVKLTSPLGFGTSTVPKEATPAGFAESVKTLGYVADNYTNFFNGGEFYGADGANLKALRQFLEDRLAARSPAGSRPLILSIKGSVDMKTFTPDGSKEGIDRSIGNIVRTLNDVRDRYPKDLRPLVMYEIARVDSRVPYTESIGYIYEHVKNGDIDGISLSETGAKTIEAAASVAPISAVEVEFSLFTQDIRHNGVLATCRKLGIPIVAYSPLCRGLLTKQCVQDPQKYLDAIPETDMRKAARIEKFLPENFMHNVKCLEALQQYAHERYNADLEQLAIGYIVKLSTQNSRNNLPSIIPIPSGSTAERIDRNFKSVLPLTDQDIDNIHDLLDTYKVKGLRYNSKLEALCFQ
ncbi:aldo/keto reductase [Gregarina niphandrodes]|uniref:Aldo/keto reductase n=1 Tax=Gregarina niphandrodes TaxID=110365 RepID=A0A023B181_GRENI|nr:aldo/keto reductase [Gregarina niphandrodes]EZG46382.1 aldo/keto reductase [Gregarina niphandrodes]|eukprot:XP_011132310.1 aldo/keto reductase [Gregarina niphandrodes]